MSTNSSISSKILNKLYWTVPYQILRAISNARDQTTEMVKESIFEEHFTFSVAVFYCNKALWRRKSFGSKSIAEVGVANADLQVSKA